MVESTPVAGFELYLANELASLQTRLVSEHRRVTRTSRVDGELSGPPRTRSSIKRRLSEKRRSIESCFSDVPGFGGMRHDLAEPHCLWEPVWEPGVRPRPKARPALPALTNVLPNHLPDSSLSKLQSMPNAPKTIWTTAEYASQSQSSDDEDDVEQCREVLTPPPSSHGDTGPRRPSLQFGRRPTPPTATPPFDSETQALEFDSNPSAIDGFDISPKSPTRATDSILAPHAKGDTDSMKSRTGGSLALSPSRSSVMRKVSFLETSSSHAALARSERKKFNLRQAWRDGDDEETDRNSSLAAMISASSFRKRSASRGLPEELLTSEQSALDYFIIEPNASASFIWDIIGASFILFDFIYIPLQAFDVEATTWSLVLSWWATLFWTCDLGRSFFVGYHEQGFLIRKFRLSVRHYLKGWFGIDLTLVLMDWTTTIVIASADTGQGVRSFLLLRLVRLTKLLRVLKLLASLRSFESRILSERVSIILRLLKLTASIILMCHVIGCSWFAIGNRQPGWVSGYIADASFSYSYSSSFHWALTQFTPASIDIQPTNFHERFFGICTLLFAFIVFSLFVSGITNALQEFRNLSESKARQLWVLRRYLNQCNVPIEVSMRVQAYCNFSWEARTRTVQENEVAILQMLSTPLRSELRTAVFEPRLVTHALFMLVSKVAPLTMQELCNAAATRVLVAPGDMLFCEGQHASKMYFLIAGRMSYEHQLGSSIADDGLAKRISYTSGCTRGSGGESVDHGELALHAGDWACEVALWIDWDHLGSLYSETECDLVMLDEKAFHEAMQNNKHTKHEALQYARGFVAGLNRADEKKISDLYVSSQLEGLWFRLLQEFNVQKRYTKSVLRRHGYFRSLVYRISCCFRKGLKPLSDNRTSVVSVVSEGMDDFKISD